MTTFDYNERANFYYLIDEVTNHVTINSKCDYPCKDCPQSGTDADGEPIYDVKTCIACFDDPAIPQVRAFLQVDTCVEKCAADRYFDETTQRCELCDPKCLSCDGQATSCTSCGVGDYLFLHENQCLTECPDRFIEDPSSNNCQRCYSRCLTCEGLSTSCTSCDRGSPLKFFYQEDCIEECFPLQSVQVGDECVECDSTCLECEGTPTTCTKCESHMKLDPSTATCEPRCEREVQVFNTETEECEYCADTCTKCAGTRDTCTACEPGYVLNFDQTCRETCSELDQTPIDGICTACEEPCYECEGSVSTCKTCIADYFLYTGTKCLQYCPEKYKVEDGVCVYEGLVCPDGFQLN